MPQTEIVVYQETDGTVPLEEWLDELRMSSPQAHGKCVNRILQLSEFGYELQRPLTETIEGGLYALRVKVKKINFRIFYFFHGKNVAVLIHGCTKEGAIPETELKRARERKAIYENDPQSHAADWRE